MESVRLCNFSPSEVDQKFLEFLSQILKNNDVDVIVTKKTLTAESWPEIQKLLEGNNAAILDFATSEHLTQQIPALPTDVRILQCADSMFFQDGAWWPRLNLKEAIRHSVVSEARSLDIKDSAYIIGEGAMLRMTGALAASFGYKKIFLVGLLEDDIERQAKELQQYFVGIDWKPLLAHQMTMQTSGASLLINSISLGDNPLVMSDLAYFNFMKSDGLVVDLNVLPLENNLLIEAKQARLRTLSGFDIRTQQDFTFIERLGFSSLISEDAYKVKWHQFLLEIS